MVVKKSSLVGVMVLAFVVAVAPVDSAAQASPEEEAVIAVVNTLFDGMRAGDEQMILGTVANGARLAMVSGDSVRYVDMSAFAANVAATERHLDERVWDFVIEIDASLASVWVKYDILIDGEFSHCGIDSFEMLMLNGEWKIVHLADTRRTGPDCWRYPGS